MTKGFFFKVEILEKVETLFDWLKLCSVFMEVASYLSIVTAQEESYEGVFGMSSSLSCKGEKWMTSNSKDPISGLIFYSMCSGS